MRSLVLHRLTKILLSYPYPPKDKIPEGNDSHSSGEYSSVEKEAQVAVSGKGKDMAVVISSGKSAQEKRRQNREKKEKEEKEDEKKE